MTNGQDKSANGVIPNTDDIVIEVRKAVLDQDQEKLLNIFESIHEADIADILEQIDPEIRRKLVELWGHKFDVEVLSELQEPVQAEIASQMPIEQLINSVGDLESDEMVDLVENLPSSQQKKILARLDDSYRDGIEKSLRFPQGSAGRLMQREIVMVPAHWDVGQAIDYMRSSDNLTEQFYHMILIDPKARLVGIVALGKLMASTRLTKLTEIANKDYHSIRATDSQKDVAYAFNQYHLISAPVVDEGGQILGVITIDDAMSVLDKEAEEDILRLAGVGDESLSERVTEIAFLRRFPWLIVNLITAIIASIVIDHFAYTIESLVALAVLMPIVASMGGNAGTQTLTVAVRSLATRDLTRSNAFRIIRREILVGVINGILFAIIAGLIGLIWFGTPVLGGIMGLAMIITLTIAGIVGIIIPLGLSWIRVDPALASGVFVTTVTDCVGFFAFLGLASLILL